ncbi:hypothetical protein DyAD56_04430 [Dyella sp. AD56]|nr:hypothetical protein DyAD56_04430 [Dyella sp. AD56]
MRLYTRVLIAAKPETYSQAETDELRSTIASAPGIEEIASVSKHFKGGYDVVVQLTEDSVESFLGFLWKAGYRSAI